MATLRFHGSRKQPAPIPASDLLLAACLAAVALTAFAAAWLLANASLTALICALSLAPMVLLVTALVLPDRNP